MRAKLFTPHQHVSNPISIIVSIVLLSLFIPRHNAKHDTKLYEACNKTTSRACGKPIREGIGFPFWGDGIIRDKDCGLEEFELSCEESGLAVDIGPYIKYNVVEINSSAKVIQLKPDSHSPLEYICNPDSRSIPETMSNGKPYDYGQKTKDLHLFYNCNHEAKTQTYLNFTCPNVDKDPVYFFLENPLPQDGKDLGSCSYTTLPFNWTLLEEFIMNPINPQQLFSSSFEVYYNSTTDQKACADCVSDGGLCWMGTYPDSNDTCLFPGVPNLITLWKFILPPSQLFTWGTELDTYFKTPIKYSSVTYF